MTASPHLLEDETVLALRFRGADWPRSFLSETPIPDKWMGLIERADGRRKFVPSGEPPGAAPGDHVTLVRNRPIELSIETAGTSKCGHDVTARSLLTVRWHAREDDLAALREALLRRDVLSLADLNAAFSDGGAQAVLRRFVAARTVEQLLSGDPREDFSDALLQDEPIRRFIFESGLAIERVARLTFTSESFDKSRAIQRDAQRRVEQLAARETIERAASAATLRRLDDLHGVLERLKSLPAGDAQMRWHELLPGLSPAERGRLLENLWRLTPDRVRTEAVVAVAGNQVVWVDPASPDKLLKRAGLPDDFGGLRCVDFEPKRSWLLVGAARGVWAISTDDGAVAGRYDVAGVDTPRTGFNAVLEWRDRLYATHSALGVWSWPLDGDGPAHSILQPHSGVPRSVRCPVGLDDGRVLFAADDCLHAFDPSCGELSALGTADDVIHSVAAVGQRVFVGTDSGRIMQLDLRHPDDWWQAHRARDAVETLSARRWDDLIEVVAPVGADGVLAIYPDESFTAQLMAPNASIRRAWVSDDVVVALSDNRDRLFVLQSLGADRRGREATISRLVGHSVQDVCLISRPNTAGADG